MLEGTTHWSPISKDLAHDLIIVMAGQFKVPVPEVRFTCRDYSRGWYHYPECDGCKDPHPQGSIRLGRNSVKFDTALHEFAHHLVRHKLTDWRDLQPHGWDFKRYHEQTREFAVGLGMEPVQPD